jgi:hypothetical protein
MPLTESPDLVPVPPVDLSQAVVLHEKSYNTWSAMFAANTAALDYLLTPGDYSSWGVLGFNKHPGNTEARPKTIRYYNPGVDDALHPAQRSDLAQARVESVRFDHEGWCKGSRSPGPLPT